MGEFTKLVQADKVSGPLRRAFTATSWKKGFDACLEADETDKNVYATGLLIHEKLHNIRTRLKLSTSPTLSATTKMRAFVAAVNHNFLVTRENAHIAIAKLGHERAQQEPEGFRIEDLTAVKLKLPGGFDWTPNEIVESSIDGVEVPVSFALAASPDLSGNPRMDQVQWGDISLELNLGVFYRFAEDLWNDCLWNGYKLIDTGHLKAFIPTDLDASLSYSMGLARRQSLSIGYTAIATSYHRDMIVRGLIPRVREIRAIERKGKRQVIKLETPSEPSKAQEELLVARSLATEPYYADILSEPRDALCGQSVSMLLTAWGVVARASLLLLDAVAKKHADGIDTDSPTHVWLPGYAPVLQTEALVQAVSSVTGVTRAQSKNLVEFLTFRGRSGQEIWAQPLVPVGPSAIVPVFGATVSPNLRRLVDVWLRQLEIDLSVRGPAFEVHLRTLVEQGIAESKILAGSAWSLKDDYTFKPAGSRSEQIDLLLVIGTTVILAEAKCILEPTDAKAIAMHRRTVLGAAEQARRKSQSLHANRADFVADMKKRGYELTENFDLVPLVVLSTSTHVGVAANGIPVVDEYILGRFLDGELGEVAMSGVELTIRKTLKTVFYSSAAEAQDRAASYFSAPPQMKKFEEGVNGRMIPLHAIDENDWRGVVVTLECVPEAQPMLQQSEVKT